MNSTLIHFAFYVKAVFKQVFFLLRFSYIDYELLYNSSNSIFMLQEQTCFRLASELVAYPVHVGFCPSLLATKSV